MKKLALFVASSKQGFQLKREALLKQDNFALKL